MLHKLCGNHKKLFWPIVTGKLLTEFFSSNCSLKNPGFSDSMLYEKVLN